MFTLSLLDSLYLPFNTSAYFFSITLLIKDGMIDGPSGLIRFTIAVQL
jgi:hypothetical protein